MPGERADWPTARRVPHATVGARKASAAGPPRDEAQGTATWTNLAMADGDADDEPERPRKKFFRTRALSNVLNQNSFWYPAAPADVPLRTYFPDRMQQARARHGMPPRAAHAVTLAHLSVTLAHLSRTRRSRTPRSAPSTSDAATARSSSL